MVEFKKALELSPSDGEILFQLGGLCTNMGNYPEAESYYRKSLGINSMNLNAHCKLGLLLEVQGKYPAAVLDQFSLPAADRNRILKGNAMRLLHL